jgi:hypothetical protein
MSIKHDTGEFFLKYHITVQLNKLSGSTSCPFLFVLFLPEICILLVDILSDDFFTVNILKRKKKKHDTCVVEINISMLTDNLLSSNVLQFRIPG